MKRLYFIRYSTAWEHEDYYESKTDVWLMGDASGYDYFRESLAAAESAKATIDLVELPKRSASMRAVITPAATRPAKSPRIKVIERVVFRTRRPEMELVFHGNRAGYRRLASIVKDLTARDFDNSINNRYINDWWDRWIVKRSVALNLRGSVGKWSKRARQQLKSYRAFTRGESYFPDNMGYLTKEIFPYKTATAKNNPFLSLHDSTRET